VPPHQIVTASGADKILQMDSSMVGKFARANQTLGGDRVDRGRRRRLGGNGDNGALESLKHCDDAGLAQLPGGRERGGKRT
jgi:hypothetical protein